jgi:hypothetical protein
VKQSQLFLERHPTLDPNQTQQQQEQMQAQHYDEEPEGDNPDGEPPLSIFRKRGR